MIPRTALMLNFYSPTVVGAFTISKALGAYAFFDITSFVLAPLHPIFRKL
jgi:hypothetical protein